MATHATAPARDAHAGLSWGQTQLYKRESTKSCAIMHLSRTSRAGSRYLVWNNGRRARYKRTQTQGKRCNAGYSLNSLSAGSVRHESCQLIRHVRDHTRDGQATWQELPDAEALSTLDDLLVDDYTHIERMTELEGSLGA